MSYIYPSTSYREVVKNVKDISLAVNFVTTSVLSTLNKLEITLDEFYITPSMLSNLIDVVSADKLIITETALKNIEEALK